MQEIRSRRCRTRKATAPATANANEQQNTATNTATNHTGIAFDDDVCCDGDVGTGTGVFCYSSSKRY